MCWANDGAEVGRRGEGLLPRPVLVEQVACREAGDGCLSGRAQPNQGVHCGRICAGRRDDQRAHQLGCRATERMSMSSLRGARMALRAARATMSMAYAGAIPGGLERPGPRTLVARQHTGSDRRAWTHRAENGSISLGARSSSNCSGPSRSDTAEANCNAGHRSSTIPAAPTRLVADKPTNATSTPARSPSRCAPAVPRIRSAARTASRGSPVAPDRRAEVKPPSRSTPAPAAVACRRPSDA